MRLLFWGLHGRELLAHHALRHLFLRHQAAIHGIFVLITNSPSPMTMRAFHHCLVTNVHCGDEVQRQLAFGFVHAEHTLPIALRAIVHDEPLRLDVIPGADNGKHDQNSNT